MKISKKERGEKKSGGFKNGDCVGYFIYKQHEKL
jgi:hypothetical protein